MVALAEELLTLLMLAVTSLTEALALGTEMTVSINPIRTNPASRIAAIIKNNFFTSTVSNHTSNRPQVEEVSMSRQWGLRIALGFSGELSNF